jgi:RNA recognition motif-containing protein
LLLSNVPPNCRDEYLRRWIEARGYRVSSLRVVKDITSGTSPSFAYVQLMNSSKLDEAVRALNGQTLEGRTIQAARVTPVSNSA